MRGQEASRRGCRRWGWMGMCS
uniref:Uncharacterized protein n=1 Tax=Arundo donax TaxID=35708 RepID=A0A0A9H400_ARUDO